MGKKGKRKSKRGFKRFKKKRVEHLEVNLLIENGKNVHGEDPMQLIEY